MEILLLVRWYICRIMFIEVALTNMLNLRYINNPCFNAQKRIFLYQCAFIAVWESYCGSCLIINGGGFCYRARYIALGSKPGFPRDESIPLS